MESVQRAEYSFEDIVERGSEGSISRLILHFSPHDLTPWQGGTPLLPVKNDHLSIAMVAGKPHPYRTKRAKLFIDQMWNKLKKIGLADSYQSNYWELRMIVFAPQRSRKLGGSDGRLDADACVVPVRDALQRAGFVDDDMRLLGGPTEVVYRKSEPGLIIDLKRVCDRRAWRQQWFGDLLQET